VSAYESKGLSYRHDPGAYAQGQDAWSSVTKYLHSHKDIKEPPNPFVGRHHSLPYHPTKTSADPNAREDVYAASSEWYCPNCKTNYPERICPQCGRNGVPT
jgi:hypothetical protein